MTPAIVLEAAVLLSMLALGAPAPPEASIPPEAPTTPSVATQGRGEVWAAPDRAILRLGAVVQAPEANDAQSEVHRIMSRTLEAITKLGVPRETLSTDAVALTPIYDYPRDDRPASPRLLGYRAVSTVRVRLRELGRVGDVLDAAVRAGANQIEEVSFSLANDLEARERAMRLAMQEAKAKAIAVASALEMRLGAPIEVVEGTIHISLPTARMASSRALETAGPPMVVEPGQVRIEAELSARFHLLRR